MKSSAGILARNARSTVSPPMPESNTPRGRSADTRELFRPQVRKQQHVADRGAIGEEHHQPIDAHAEPRRWRHAVLERANVVGVEVHGLLVTFSLACGLRAKAGCLLLGIIEFGKTIGKLAPSDKQLEAVGDERILIVTARQRRDLSG